MHLGVSVASSVVRDTVAPCQSRGACPTSLHTPNFANGTLANPNPTVELLAGSRTLLYTTLFFLFQSNMMDSFQIQNLSQGPGQHFALDFIPAYFSSG